MARYSRKKGNCAPNRKIGKRCLKTKRYAKDIDQIVEEIGKGMPAAQKRPYEMIDELPGAGNFFCNQCDRFFVDRFTLEQHSKSKQHKQRVKKLKETPYSHAESEQAGGLGSYQLPAPATALTATESMVE